MEAARNMGRYIKDIIKEKEIDEDLICYDLGCTKRQWNRLLAGRCFMSFEQASNLAAMLDVTTEELIKSSEKREKDNSFSNQDNKEMILDIVDQYMDLQEAIEER